MKIEEHRDYAIKAFQKYQNDQINLLTTIDISKFDENTKLKFDEQNIVYILRLNIERKVDSSVLAIPNRNDTKNILYIGGHKQGVGGTRYLDLIWSCRKAETDFIERNESAYNDRTHKHSVAGSLTTALLKTKFSINDCIIDVFTGYPEYNELEFIIGYQERYHHLPPWNSNRKGEQGYDCKT